MIFFLILIVILEFFILIFLVSAALSLASRVPFIRSPEDIYFKVWEEMKITPGSKVYDLGCGDLRVLAYLAKKSSTAKYFGFEKRLYPFLLGKWRIKTNDLKNDVFILKKDFFGADLSQATHIFTYLFPFVMDKLLPKLQKELQPGSVLISIDFPFKNKGAEKVIEIPKSKYALGKRIYVYKF